jgi:Sugar (and other) transporter
MSLVFYTLSGILYATTPQLLLAVGLGRCLAGIGHGLIYVTTIIHGSEIAVPKMRGFLMASLSFCLIIGSLTSVDIYKGGKYSSLPFFDDPNRIVGLVTLMYVALAAIIGGFLTYESPVFLIQRGRIEEAKAAMLKLRNETVETTEIRHDYKDLRAMVAEDEKLKGSIFQDRNLKPLMTITAVEVLSALTFNYPLNVVRVVLSHRAQVFSTHLSISGVRSLVGFFSLLTFDLVPRRSYFKISGMGSIVTLVLITICSTIYESTWWLPVAVLLFDAMAGLAIPQLTDIFSAEAFPLTKKLDSLIFSKSVESLLQAGLVLAMTGVNNGPVMRLTVLTSFSVLIAGFVTFLTPRLPETLNKSIRQTRDLFRDQKILQD